MFEYWWGLFRDELWSSSISVFNKLKLFYHKDWYLCHSSTARKHADDTINIFYSDYFLKNFSSSLSVFFSLSLLWLYNPFTTSPLNCPTPCLTCKWIQISILTMRTILIRLNNIYLVQIIFHCFINCIWQKTVTTSNQNCTQKCNQFPHILVVFFLFNWNEQKENNKKK